MIHDQTTGQIGFFDDVPCPAPLPVAQAPKKKVVAQVTATSVALRVAAEFSMSDMFGSLRSAESNRRSSLQEGRREATLSLSSSASPESSASAEGTEGDEEDDYACGPNRTVTDEQLRAEEADWFAQLTDQRAALMLWDMRVASLEENLAVLLAVTPKDWMTREKGFALQWIFADNVDTSGRNITAEPFSFHQCCLAAGYRPDTLRALLLQVNDVRELLLGLRLCRPADLPPVRRKVMYSDIVGLERSIPEQNCYQFAEGH